MNPHILLWVLAAVVAASAVVMIKMVRAGFRQEAHLRRVLWLLLTRDRVRRARRVVRATATRRRAPAPLPGPALELAPCGGEVPC